MSEFFSYWIRHAPWLFPLGVASAALVWWDTRKARQQGVRAWCTWPEWACYIFALAVVVDGLIPKMPVFFSQFIRHAPWIVPLGVASAVLICWDGRKASQSSFFRWFTWAVLPFGLFFSLCIFGLLHAVNEFMTWISVQNNIPILVSLLVPPITFSLSGCILVLLSGPFWRPIRVFVSFQHDREEEANVIEKCMRAAKLEVMRLPFDPGVDHSSLLIRVRQLLRRCDALVCLPGARTSFVDAEILAASTMNKAIVFVVAAESSRLPNTALYGYPVFRLQKLASRQYMPLVSMLKLACGDLRESLIFSNFGRYMLTAFPSVGIGVWLLLGYWLMACLAGALAVAYLESPMAAVSFILNYPSLLLDAFFDSSYENILGFIVCASSFVLGIFLYLVGLRNVRSTLRQTRFTHSDSFITLRSSLGRTLSGRRMLVCLMRGPLQAHHEARLFDAGTCSTGVDTRT